MDLARLDTLDLRIVGALQIDGRASWRRIAEVLGESERTVSRRGRVLLDDGTVRVVALSTVAPTYLARLVCRPTSVPHVAAVLARRPDAVFVYTLAGECDILVEFMVDVRTRAATLSDEIGGIDGVLRLHLGPVLHYFRTVAGWRPGLLTPAEIAHLEPDETPPERSRTLEALDETDTAIVGALVADGRIPTEEIALLGGFSEATARRRVLALIRGGVVRVRAVIEPALLGHPVEAVVQVDCPPGDTMELGAAIAASPHVRYAALTLGRPGLVVDVATPDLDELRGFLTTGPWVRRARALQPDLVLRAHKRSGLIDPAHEVDPA